MMNNDEEELQQLRERVRRLEQRTQADETPTHAPPQPEIGMGRRAMNFMYNAGHLHAGVRNFLWAMRDGVIVAGYIVSATGAVVKATPAVLAKAKAAFLAAQALAAANPVGAGVAAAAATAAAIEHMTRYEDEEGNTRHRCTIM